MRLEIATALVAAAVVCITPQRSMATTYDVVSDFNDTGTQPEAGNPFTYGTEQTLNGFLTLFSNFGTASCTSGVCTSNGSVDNYYGGTNFVGATTGLAHVTTGNTLFFSDGLLVIPNNVLIVAPTNTTLNVTRFTAPATGVYNLAGLFSDLQVSSVGLAILVNGSTDFTASYSGSSPHQANIPFSIDDISLMQGMTLDFVIDSLGNQNFDVVGLQGDISTTSGMASGTGVTPLPAALPLFATGVGIMGWFGRCRKRMAVIAD